MENVLKDITAVAIPATLAILTVVVKAIVDVAITYIGQKKDALIAQIGADKYNSNLNIARSIFYIVEQQFKGVANVALQKQKLFDSLLLQKIPGLAQTDIDHFREAVCGEINSKLKDIKIMDTAATIQPIQVYDTSTSNAINESAPVDQEKQDTIRNFLDQTDNIIDQPQS